MHYLFLVALAFMLSLPVAAQDFEKAEEATQRGDYTTTLREWRLLAEKSVRQCPACGNNFVTVLTPGRRRTLAADVRKRGARESLTDLVAKF